MIAGAPLIAALEGPCCAGKTTLGRALAISFSPRYRVAWVSDYSDWAGGGRLLPSPDPGSLAGEEQALRRFLEIEADRTATARAAGETLDLILVDRSVHTLLAHCAALSDLSGLEYRPMAARIAGEAPDTLWPDLILYVDVDEATITARNQGKFPSGSLFLDPAFNRSIRRYFKQLPGVSQRRVSWLDGTADARLLQRHAHACVTRALTARVDGGTTL